MPPQIDLSSDGNVEFDEDQLLGQFTNAADVAISITGLEVSENSELSILVASDETLQSLNRQWRNKDKPTNVLSFEGGQVALGNQQSVFLGDIAISLETAAREAKLENKLLGDHITHLFAHGFLHLFGYDHENDTEADQMESLERKVLAELGIADPYA